MAKDRENHKLSNDLIRENHFEKENNLGTSDFKYNDINELISGKGITHITKKYNYNCDFNASDPREEINKKL